MNKDILYFITGFVFLNVKNKAKIQKKAITFFISGGILAALTVRLIRTLAIL